MTVRSVRLAALTLLLLPAPAVAQTVPDTFDRLCDAALLEPKDAIEVTDVTGRRLKGRLSTLSAASLAILTEAPRPQVFFEADVTPIRRRDSLLNGLLIGLGIGFGAGLAAQGALCGGYSDSECSTIVGVVISLPTVVGSAIGGVLLDTAIRKTVYRAPSRGPAY